MSITLSVTWKVGGVATNVTSAKLSAEDGTYGIKRDDTDVTVVDDDTAMTNVGTGQYNYTMTEPEDGLEYTAWVEIVYGGNTYWFERDLTGTTSTTLSSDYAELRERIAYYLGFGRTAASWSAAQIADINASLKDGLRRFCCPPPLPGERYSHEWSFLLPVSQLTLSAGYSTGTVTVVDGVVTLDSGTFPTWAAQGVVAVDGATYSVATRDSGTQVTLEDTSVDVDAGTSYDLNRWVYTMPSDFGGLEGPITYDPGANVNYAPIEIVAEYQVRDMLAGAVTTGRPRAGALRCVETHDATVGQRWEFTVWPPTDSAYVLNYRWRRDPANLDATNVYPPGGQPHAMTILEACLAAAETSMDDKIGIHEQRFAERLLWSVSHDRRMMGSEFLGKNVDRSDGPMSPAAGSHGSFGDNWRVPYNSTYYT